MAGSFHSKTHTPLSAAAVCVCVLFGTFLQQTRKATFKGSETNDILLMGLYQSA